MLRILVVEDTPSMRARLVHELTERATGYEVVTADNRAEATRLLVSKGPNLVLLDLVIPPRSGESATSWTEGREVLRYVRQNMPHVKVVVLSSRGDLARDFLIDEEADDFFTKDSAEEWIPGKLLGQVEALIGRVVCRSAAMQQTRRQLQEVREADAVVVLEGEAGTGRKYLASVIHRCSGRATRRLEHLTCATHAPQTFLAQLVGVRGTRDRAGMLESPETGTILLEGVDELEEEAQEQLARLLAGLRDGSLHFQPLGAAEELTSGVRLILTVTVDPRNASKGGRVAERLAARLDPSRSADVKLVTVPPLRARREDLAELAGALLVRHALANKIGMPAWDPRCFELLAACELPGNAMALDRVIGSACLRAQENKVMPWHLDLPLPQEFVIRFGAGGAVEEHRVSRAGLMELTDRHRFDLLVEVAEGGSAAAVQVKGDTVALDDSRLGSLLVLLMQDAGTPVDLKQHRRRLGIAASDPLKRYVFKLRKLLRDTKVVKRSSEFLTSHYGERYSFNSTCCFALVWHRQRSPSPS